MSSAVNAADNKQRDSTMDQIKVNIDRETNTISIYNTGRGIPVEMHAKEKIYVPELIFGHLLTSSNYNDKEKKTTGGRNGYGAKLANIFSTSFIVETADSKSGKKYKQEFTDNMSKGHGKGKVRDNKKGEDWTKITFTPDLAKFGMTELDDDIIALMTRRVYDIAGVTRDVKTFLNDKRIPIKTFKDYVGMVLQNREGSFPVAHQKVNDRWEVCVTVSNAGFQQVSFVNSIATTKGGTHVNYISDQVVKHLQPMIKKKNKALQVKPHQIKAHLWVFVNCLVENPTFDSQTKENHTLAASKFGSKAELDGKFMKEIAKSGIIDNILLWASVKGQELMSKKSGGAKRTRLSGIPKLDDANEAGGRNSKKCTLILTEGDSAKTLALSGLSIIGRDFYGVFPLKGKPLNVRDASQKQVMDNVEIKSIVEIMGLKYGFKYDESTLSKLRYGAIMIMADQDQDGSHIKGLIINFIHHFWPELLKTEGFLVEFITPIVKVAKGKTEKQFYTLPEYEQWGEVHGEEKGWKIKYYKGLGTSTPQEAKSYFAAMDKHQLGFVYGGPDDDTAIDMAFAKSKVEDRKTWLRGFQKGTFLDHSIKEINYSQFIHKELILFSMADNVRSIPSMVDGFKPGQRKIIYSCFKRKLTQEIKVAQLAGYVAEHSAYHHGEASLTGTIVGMAQTYIGSNNIALLEPCGQFGTRIQGGKDAASPRYIFTRLATITRLIFHPHDDALLEFLEDDGQSIEPEWYLPILPMSLVNGCDGIGTGWSSKVPSYDPRALSEYIKAKLTDADELPELLPFFNGFTGQISKDPKKKDRYNVCGIVEKTDDNTIEVTELPVQQWTQDYKIFLEGLLTGDEKASAFESKAKKAAPKEPSIKDYKEYHTDTTVHFKISLSDAQMASAEAVGLNKKFQMEKTIAVSNMVLFDQHGRLKKYEAVEDIVEDFYEIRLSFYQKRKDNLTDKLTQEWTRLDNKVKFILEIIESTLELRNRPKKELLADMKERGYTEFPKKKADAAAAAAAAATQEEDAEELSGPSSDGFDYLLSMPFWSLTMEKVDKLKAERAGKEEELETLLAKSPKDIWSDDLDEFLVQLQVVDNLADDNFASNEVMRKKAGRAQKAPKKKRGGEDESEDDDWAPKKAKKKAPKKEAPKKEAPKKEAPKRDRPVESKVAPLSPGEASPAPKQAKLATKKPVSKAPAFMLSDSDDDEPTMSLAARLAANTNTKPVAKKAAPKKKAVKKAADSDDDFLVDDEVVTAAPAPSARGGRRAAASKATYVDSESENDDSENFSQSEAEEDDTYDAPVPVKKAAKKAAPKKKVVESSEEDDESDAYEAPAPVKKAAPKKAAPKKAAPKKKAVESSEEDEESDPYEAPAPVKKAAPKKAAPKKKAVPKKTAAAAAAKTAAPKKKAATSKKKAVESDEDDFKMDEDEDDVAEAAAPVARGGRRAAASKVKYSFSDDESEVDLLDEGSGSDW